MRFDEFAEELGGVFAEFAVLGAEGGEEVAVNVEFADDFSFCENGNDNFGFCLEGACEVAHVSVDVVDDNGLAAGCGGSTDALIEGDAGVRGHAAAEWTEDEHVGVFGVDHVEADPVVASEPFVEQAHDGVHQGVDA